MTLKYIGKMASDTQDLRMWNIEDATHPLYKSTRTFEDLKKLGIIPANAAARV